MPKTLLPPHVYELLYVQKKEDYSPKEIFPFDMTFTENPLGPSPHLKKKISGKLCLNLLAGYNTPYHSKLIKKISLINSISSESILLTRGSSGAMETIAKTFLSTKDKVLFPVASFPFFDFLCTLSRAQVSHIQRDEDFLLSPEIVFKAITKKTKFLFITNPNNPTGLLESPKTLLRIIKGIPKSVILILDEANIEYAPTHTLIHEATRRKNLIVLRSFSKIYGLAGARIGYCVSHPHTISLIKKIQTPHSVPSISSFIAFHSLGSTKHLEKTRKFVSKEIVYLQNSLNTLGFSCTPSQSNSILAKIPSTFHSSNDLIKLLNKKGVNVVNGSFFAGLSNQYIRISPRTHSINKKFVSILKSIKEQ